MRETKQSRKIDALAADGLSYWCDSPFGVWAVRDGRYVLVEDPTYAGSASAAARRVRQREHSETHAAYLMRLMRLPHAITYEDCGTRPVGIVAICPDEMLSTDRGPSRQQLRVLVPFDRWSSERRGSWCLVDTVATVASSFDPDGYVTFGREIASDDGSVSGLALEYRAPRGDTPYWIARDGVPASSDLATAA